MMLGKPRLAALAFVLAIAGCTTIPAGPSVLVLPGTGKNFDQFRVDEIDCRQYATAQVGGTSAQGAAADSGAKSALLGTAVGAAAGAAFGGSSGAAVGAGAGLLLGAAAGAGAAESSGYHVQRRYDHAFTQCMYAKGHRIPVSARYARQYQPASYPPPPPGAYAPPPPPNAPPPPPR